MKTLLRPAISLFVLLTAVTGVVYPLVVTGIAKVAFPEAASGSLIVQDGKAVGSRLIGQSFTDPKHFWGRPSATGPMPYNASASGGSNPVSYTHLDVYKRQVLAKQRFSLRERDIHALSAHFVHFSAHTRMSGVDLGGRQIRKGAADAIRKHVESLGGAFPLNVSGIVDEVARRGSTPLVVSEGTRVVGVIELKDIVKGGIKERFAELRKMGIKTVMVTGDNRVTDDAIPAEAGADDFL